MTVHVIIILDIGLTDFTCSHNNDDVNVDR